MNKAGKHEWKCIQDDVELLSCIQLRESLPAALMTTAQSEEEGYYIALTWMYPTHFDRHLFFFSFFFYYFHAIYIEREKASITLFLSLFNKIRSSAVGLFLWCGMSALLQLPFIFLFVSPDGKRVCGSIIIYIYTHTEAYITHCSAPPSLAGPTATSLKMCVLCVWCSRPL